MRIAVILHTLHERTEAESEYVIGPLAELWQQQGHEVKFLSGCRDSWAADVAILHVDLSVVPASYVRFARSYPAVLNDRIVDIRKSRISTNLVEAACGYQGPVIVKSDLNSAGIPEEKFRRRSQSSSAQHPSEIRPPEQPLEFVKRYMVYASVKDIPHEVLTRPGIVIERFRPEVDGEWFIKRECFVLGDRAISYRMRDKQPIVEGGVAFEWIENAPEVLAAIRAVGLDYGVVDYTEHEGEVVILDINKTVGVGRLRLEAERNDYDRVLRYLGPGIDSFIPSSSRLPGGRWA